MRQVTRSIPFPTQKTGAPAAAFFNDFTSPMLAMSGGYGSAKTYTLSCKYLALAYINHGQPGKGNTLRSMLTEPTTSNIADTLIPTLEEIMEMWGLPYEINSKRNGWNLWLPEAHHIIMLRSANVPKWLKGPNLTGFAMDEAAICPKESWEIGSSRVRDDRGKVLQACAVGTPETMLGWFYEQFATGDYPDTRLIYAPTSTNLQNLPRWYVERMRRQYDEEAFRIFAEGQFAASNRGSVFGRHFKRETHARDIIPISQAVPLFWGMDFNVDPMCAQAFQVIDGHMRIVDELYLRDTDTAEFGKEMKRLWPHDRFRDQEIFCDIGGKGRHTSAGGQTDVSILKQLGFRVKYRSVANESDPINEVRAMLRNAAGDIRLHVSKSCHRVISALESWQYKEGSMKTKEEEYKRSDALRHVPHMCDAVKYPVHILFPITRESARIVSHRA